MSESQVQSVVCGDQIEVIRSAQAGDRESCELLARDLRRPMFGLALQLLGNREDALDVAQDSLFRFFRTLDRFDASRPVLPWVRQIVRNRVIDLRRRQAIRRSESLDSGGREGSGIEVLDPSMDTAERAEEAQLRELVWACVCSLRDDYREILVVREYQDLSYQEIAGLLEIPLGTVMSRLHRARRELRAMVRSRGSLLLPGPVGLAPAGGGGPERPVGGRERPEGGLIERKGEVS